MSTLPFQQGSSQFKPAQVLVAPTATPIVAARPGRNSVTVMNTSSVLIYIGPDASVTTTNGFPIMGTPGASVTLPYDGQLYAVSASGSNIVGVMETY